MVQSHTSDSVTRYKMPLARMAPAKAVNLRLRNFIIAGLPEVKHNCYSILVNSGITIFAIDISCSQIGPMSESLKSSESGR